jgi:hypothetical protein
LLTKREPKYKIGTLLRNSYGAKTSEQVMIVRTYVIMGQTTTHEGLVVGNEVRMYDLMYLGEGGRKDSQTERWLHRAISNKKIEIAAAPD